ncbi:hypothetical protein CEH05_18300 [Halobacillus halophilus]|nr:hypothetical protein CEH05_18300 [Halobacillus halophilus]
MKISTKTFNFINNLSNAIFILSILVLIYYSTIMGDSIKWEMSIPIGLLMVCYLLLLKSPKVNNFN